MRQLYVTDQWGQKTVRTWRKVKVEDGEWDLIRVEAFVNFIDGTSDLLEIARAIVDVEKLSVRAVPTLTPGGGRYETCHSDTLRPGDERVCENR